MSTKKDTSAKKEVSSKKDTSTKKEKKEKKLQGVSTEVARSAMDNADIESDGIVPASSVEHTCSRYIRRN